MFALRRLFLLLAIGLSLGAPSVVFSQAFNRAQISGRVVDAASGEGLPGAHVFIASSMIGTVTDTNGDYVLENVPLGAHRLYVSILGFEHDFLDILLRTDREVRFNFELKESILEAGEIIVEAERDKNWKKRLERFIKMFIGETPNALETTILNPEVLDFEDKRGTFKAVASAPLIIENKALGYRIQYFLADFQSIPSRVQYDGEGLYEAMDPSSEEEALRWEEKRRTAFIGSFRHFMLALIAGRTEAQGFKTYSRPSIGGNVGDTFNAGMSMSSQRFPLDPAKLLRPGEAANEYFLDFEGHLEVVFMGEKEDESYFDWSMRPERSNPRFQTSWTFLDHGPVTVDYKGDTLDQYGVVFTGYWAFERVADDPPKEYRPK